MGEKTGISWCDHTFNPWIGCLKVSEGCQNCFAEVMAKNRMGLDVWGPPGTTGRKMTSESYWLQPHKWNKAAEKAGERRRVFCGSMMDWAEDHPKLNPLRNDLFKIISDTPWLDWLLLTKRPERIKDLLPSDWEGGYPNVWLGTSVENQHTANQRIPHLISIPAVVRFLSVEPLLGPIDLGQAHPCGYYCDRDDDGTGWGHHDHEFWSFVRTRINWVIVGGESGPGYRKMETWWAADLRDQCVRSQVPFFYKQGNGARSGQDATLEGVEWHQYPTPFNQVRDLVDPTEY